MLRFSNFRLSAGERFPCTQWTRSTQVKPEGSGVGLEPWKPELSLKNTLDSGWGTHTWRITALGGGWDTGCPGMPGPEMTAQGPSWEPGLPPSCCPLAFGNAFVQTAACLFCPSEGPTEVRDVAELQGAKGSAGYQHESSRWA